MIYTMITGASGGIGKSFAQKATDFEKNAGLNGAKMFVTFGVDKADAVVKRGYKGMMKGKPVVYHGKVTYGFNIFTRLMSRKVSRNIACKVN